MSGLVIFDLLFLVIFTLGVIIFLYKRKQKLQREGLVYLYRTKLGLKFIEETSKRYSRILKPLQYIILLSGYILMIAMVWLLITTFFIYLKQPSSSALAKVPAVFPLIPYFPQLFNLDSIFPPFYFMYFIIAIAIVAVSHEFAHGIIARLNKIKIHSTGFAFFGPFLGAFVEQDEKQMNKAKKFPQLAILAAGTFANILMMILFGILLLIFFSVAFAPSGVIFSSYSSSIINITDINAINGIPINNISLNSLNQDILNISIGSTIYYITPFSLNYSLSKGINQVFVYDDTPAFKARIDGAIIGIDYTKVSSYKELSAILSKHSPGDTIQLKTINDSKQTNEYSIKLGERDGKAYLGLSTQSYRRAGLLGSIYAQFNKVKDPNIYYISRIGDAGKFIYDLLWWIVIINLLVALFNMFPAGILDGGRFLMLTVWGITGNKKAGDVALKIMTWMLLVFVAVMMVKWVFNIF